MANIKDCSRLVKRLALINLLNDKKGVEITPMLSGQHGIGKSMILNSVAKDLGGICFVIEGGSLKEGEITGLPFAFQNQDSSSEVRFVKYHAINRIWQLEKFYYEKATTTGFLDGKVRLSFTEDGQTILHDFDKEIVISNTAKDIVNGEDNKYKFGKELSPSTKLKLLESGEILPIMIFIDELNRTELTTQKELMNIILNKSVNGYDLPWNVFITTAVNPSSQNSAYATNEMDPAQIDRFLIIKATAKLEDFIDYALEKGLNNDVIEALAIAEDIFMVKDSSLEDMTKSSPSPRSWEMVSVIYENIFKLNETKYFTDDERKVVKDDLRVLVRGKVGEDAGRTFLENIDRKENNIKPDEIITLKSRTIDEKVLNKFNNQKRLTQKIIADNVINYIYQHNGFIELSKSSDEKKKEQYLNFSAQFKQFMLTLDTATQLTVMRRLLRKYGQEFFMKIGRHISAEVIGALNDAKAALNDIAE